MFNFFMADMIDRFSRPRVFFNRPRPYLVKQTVVVVQPSQVRETPLTPEETAQAEQDRKSRALADSLNTDYLD